MMKHETYAAIAMGLAFPTRSRSGRIGYTFGATLRLLMKETDDGGE
jgi:hypothetical protein